MSLSQLLDPSIRIGKPLMKTISTKVDESVYQKLVESCGKSGSCISEKIRKLIEDHFVSETLTNQIIKSEDKHEPHYDRFGNYYTYDQNRKVWKCSLNPKNVRIRI